jgi:hypothetical protein
VSTKESWLNGMLHGGQVTKYPGKDKKYLHSQKDFCSIPLSLFCKYACTKGSMQNLCSKLNKMALFADDSEQAPIVNE